MNHNSLRIQFLCSSLEPGLDAVGDYTLCLAKACLQHGVTVQVLALGDQHCEILRDDKVSGVSTVRLPATVAPGFHRDKVREIVGEFQPDVVSLQFVAYGFHHKGLPWKLGSQLWACLGDLPIHIMFHEIWIGAERGASLKHRLVGALQKLVHRRMVSQLQPFCVHTHAEPYRRALIQAGIEPRSLPLPSNVPYVGNPDYGFIREQMAAAGIVVDGARREDLAVFLVFGHVPPEWNPDLLLRQLGDFWGRSGRKPVLFFCGRGGLDDKRREEVWECAGRYGVNCVSAGFLQAEQVSAVMQFADFGVATVPFALWQKSGVVAAMGAHGLPVIFTRFDGDWSQDWLPPWESDFLRCDEHLVERLVECPRSTSRDRWPEVVKSFLSDVTDIPDCIRSPLC